MAQLRTQIAIIGGGVAGLWLLNRLAGRGYDTLLLAKGDLGSGQTIASQGMIHGGIKYALGGFTTPSSETIASMPDRWRACLAGTGSLDLSQVSLLSSDYYLFSDSSLSSRVTAFFGSRSIRGRIEPMARTDYPAFFANETFKGSLYRLQDMVIDTGSLLSALKIPHCDRIFAADPIPCTEGNVINELKLAGDIRLVADRYIFAAGAGNEALLKLCGYPLAMQRRPLHQVIVKGEALPSVYAHAVSLSAGARPRVTISTHPTADGSRVWYLGGDLAESGVERNADDQCAYAKRELTDLFPWIEWERMLYRSFTIDRAEPSRADQSRPDAPFARQLGNVIVCWPTKLTLAPLLGDEVESMLDDLSPSGERCALPDLPQPEIGRPPWDAWF